MSGENFGERVELRVGNDHRMGSGENEGGLVRVFAGLALEELVKRNHNQYCILQAWPRERSESLMPRGYWV